MCCRENTIVYWLTLFALLGANLQADAQPAQPAEPKAGEVLEITITGVQGTAQVRESADAKWRPAVAGMEIKVGWEMRTGLRSVIQFKIGKDHSITVDRLGSVTVLDAIRADGKVKTDVGLKYGRTKYVVDAVAEEHDATVRAPSATLAVRGSEVTVSDNALFGYAAFVDHSKDVNIQARGFRQVPTIALKQGRIEGSSEQLAGGKHEKLSAAATKLSYARTGASTTQYAGARGGFSPIETTLTREEFKTTLAFNGDSADNNGGTGGGGRRQAQKFKQENQANEPPPIQLNTTALSVSVQWIGQANVDLALKDPSGKILATSTGAFGSNAVQVLRPGGPARGDAGPDDFGTGSSGQEDIDYFSEHLTGSYTAFLRFDQNNSSQPANFQLKAVQDDPNEPGGFKVLREISGTLGPGNLNAGMQFNAPTVNTGGSP